MVVCILFEYLRKITIEKVYDKYILKKIDKLQNLFEKHIDKLLKRIE